MGFRALFSGEHPPRVQKLQAKPHSNNQQTATTVAHDISLPKRIASGICKVFLVRPHSKNEVEPSSAPTSPIAPAHQYRFQSPTAATPLEPEPTVTTSTTSPPTTADSGLSPKSSAATAPTTIQSITSHTKASEFHIAKPQPQPETEYEAALEQLRNAEKILQQRHAVIKTPPKSDPGQKVLTLEVLFKKVVSNSKPEGRTHLPLKAPVPSHQKRVQPETAGAACDALQRRQLFQQLAYRAVGGCDDAIIAFEELNAHYRLKARHQGTDDIPDLILNFEGVHVPASKLCTVEHTWLSRINAASKLQSLADRKILSPDDHEQIIEQLFPDSTNDLLKPEYFSIFITGLATEGILIASESKSIIRLGVTHEEYTSGAHWTGTARNPTQRYDTSNMHIFSIPHQSYRSSTNLSANPLSPSTHTDLSHHLRILIEAAVYDQKFWKGYFFPKPRSVLHSFYQAYSLTQQGLSTPPSLTDYKRCWTYRETRLLQRGEMVCKLLESFESGKLHDYGIVRAVRGTFVRLPGQGHWDVENLSTYLYHRVADSGLPVSLIPEILALHPDNDGVFANIRLKVQILKELGEQADVFRNEEEQRLREIERSVSTFESLKKKEMSRWERMKVKMTRRKGKKEVVVPFDPFAEE